jgi:competence protein ComEC
LIFLFSFIVLVSWAVITGVAGGPDPPLRITFLDVGNGDAALIEAPDDRRILVNAGFGNEDYSAGRSRVEPFLHSKGLDRLDVLCITSGDSGAAGGAPYILENVPVSELWAGRSWRSGTSYDPMPEIAEAVAGTGVEWPEPTPNSVTCNGCSMGIVDDADSISLVLECGRFRLLYPGWRDGPPESFIGSVNARLNTTVLKAPGRGEVRDNPTEFVETVEPVIAVISAKRGGKTPRPDPAVVGAYEKAGAVVLVTADHGSVVVETDGLSARIRTAF